MEEAEELAKSSSETSSLSGSDSNDDSDDSSSSNESSESSSSSQSSDSESSYSGDSDSSGSEAGSRTTSLLSTKESADILFLSANDKVEEGVEMEKITPYRRSGSGLITNSILFCKLFTKENSAFFVQKNYCQIRYFQIFDMVFWAALLVRIPRTSEETCRSSKNPLLISRFRSVVVGVLNRIGFSY